MERTMVRDGEVLRCRSTANDAADAEQLARAACALERLAGTAAPLLLGWRPGPDAQLDESFVPGRPLDRWTPGSARSALDVLAMVATALAAVHEQGVAHGALDEAKVLVDDGAVAFTGWGHAAVDAPDAALQADVRALGTTIDAVLGRLGGGPTVPGLRTGAGDDGLAGALSTIADRADLATVEQPVTAAAIARSLDSLRLEAASPAGRHPSTGRGALAAALVAASLAGTWLLSSQRPADPPGPTPTSTAAAPSVTPTDDATHSVDVDRIVGGAVLTATGRFVLGDDDDEVLLGDWDCDGEATPALLRRPEGEVFVFDAWATATAPLVADAAISDPAIRSLGSFASGDCTLLLANRQDGTSRLVPADSPRHHPPQESDEP